MTVPSTQDVSAVEPGPNDAPLAGPPERVLGPDAVPDASGAGTAAASSAALASVPARLAGLASLDPLVDGARVLTTKVGLDRGALRALLSGDRLLGHPLHPMLTDLPIGTAGRRAPTRSSRTRSAGR